MKNTFCFILFFSLSVSIAYGQTYEQDSILAYQYINKTGRLFTTNRDSFRICLEKAIPLFKKIEDWEMYVACLNSLSTYYYKEDDYQKFEEYGLKAIQESESKLKEPSASTASALNNIGVYYKTTGDYDKAIEMYKKALSVQKQVELLAAPFIRLYQNISIAYRKTGDYDQGISYLNQAYQIQKDSLAPNDISIAKTFLDRGHLLRDKEQLEDAKKQYFKSLKIMQSLDADSIPSVIDYSIQAHQTLSKVYLAQEKVDQSYSHIQKAIRLQNDRYQSRRIVSYLILGDIFIYKKDFQAAIKAYETSNEITTNYYSRFKKKDTKARTLKSLAKAYLKSGDLKKAIQYYQSALIALSIGFEEASIDQNPQVDHMVSKIEGLEIIKGKATTLFEKYKSSNSIDDLKLAFENFSFATQIIQNLRNSFLAKGSKNELAEKSLDIYEGGIKTAYLLFQKTGDQKHQIAAVQFAEKNKARLLEESLQENYARVAGSLPEAELKKEQELSTTINFYKNKINREKGKVKNTKQDKIEVWNTTLFELDNKYNDLIKHFEKEYPNYYALKYATKNTSIQDIQTKLLNKQNALLEYFVGSKNIYLFSITKNDFKVFEISKPQNFEADITAIRTIVSQSPFESNNQLGDDRAVFVNLSHQLYETYLEPAINILPSNVNHLIIIPDDVFAYLPFELLLTEAAKENSEGYNTNSCNYLFNQFAISYNYSTSLLMDHSAREAQSGLSPFLGFAPTFGNELASNSRTCTGENVYTLQCNTKEVASISDILGGITVEGIKASVNSFHEQAQQCRILHLATHACIDNENPDLNKIYFADNYINGTDLSNLQFNAELAVLSACNTGSGKLIKGEGVMSLSRGFILSGCPSTLTSLWSVDDCTTSAIMLQYYKYLKEGLTKDEALQKAKLDHLSTADKVNSHPYYWAAFVQSGNAEAMDFSQPHPKFQYWMLLPLFVMAFYLLKKLVFLKREKAKGLNQ